MIYRNIPNTKDNLLSDALYFACMDKAKENMGPGATEWQHLADAVSRGTITPLEAYDSIKLGYVPEHLKIRVSYYSHLL